MTTVEISKAVRKFVKSDMKQASKRGGCYVADTTKGTIEIQFSRETGLFTLTVEAVIGFEPFATDLTAKACEDMLAGLYQIEVAA